MPYSKERIFESCNLHNHCVAAHLRSAISIENRPVDIIYILKLVVGKMECQQLLYNIQHGINTNVGTISAECFIDGSSPSDPIIINIPLVDIIEIESIELR